MTVMRPEWEFEKRTVLINGKQTSLALEGVYWKGVERVARDRSTTWRQVVNWGLSTKPATFSSRAGWLRIWVFAKVLEMTKRAKQAG